MARPATAITARSQRSARHAAGSSARRTRVARTLPPSNHVHEDASASASPSRAGTLGGGVGVVLHGERRQQGHGPDDEEQRAEQAAVPAHYQRGAGGQVGQAQDQLGQQPPVPLGFGAVVRQPQRDHDRGDDHDDREGGRDPRPWPRHPAGRVVGTLRPSCHWRASLPTPRLMLRRPASPVHGTAVPHRPGP